MLDYHEKCWAWANTAGLPPETLIDVSRLNRAEIVEKTTGMLQDSQAFKPRVTLEEAVERSLDNWRWLQQ